MAFRTNACQEKSKMEKEINWLLSVTNHIVEFVPSQQMSKDGTSMEEWIMEQWEKNYYISAIAGANNGSSLVVMSTGTQYAKQSYKVRDSFPFKLINKKWREGFYVTSMTTAGSKWGVAMSRNASFSDQLGKITWTCL